MNRIVRFVAGNARLALALGIAVVIVLSWLAGAVVNTMREQERLAQLKIDAYRHSDDITSQTINGHLMGALYLLGVADASIKQEVRGELAPNGSGVMHTLGIVSRLPDVDGAFVVGEDGIIRSSLGPGKSSTGVNVRFRPYLQTALKGKENVYAAVGTTSGVRTLYFAVPLREGSQPDGRPIGAVVARASMNPVDKLLAGKADAALLLSPQGVVFAATRAEWIGLLAGPVTAERLDAIRQLKQFGNMFESARPGTLPMAVDDGIRELDGRRHAVSTASVEWNDPGGHWQLVLVEDLARSIPSTERHAATAGAAAILLLIGGLLFGILRGQHRQQLASRQLDAYARAQEMAVHYKERLAAAGLRLQQARTPTALAQTFLSEAHALLGALQGVVYAVAGDGTLHLLGSYACSRDDAPPAVLSPGEGLLGECALDRRLRVLAMVPERFAAIRSGLGETRPAAVMMAPIQLQSSLLGVVEIAVLSPPEECPREHFEELLRLLAMNLELAGAVSGAEAQAMPEAAA